MRRWAIGFAIAALCSSAIAHAAPPEADAASDEARVEEARIRFFKALDLFKDQRWSAALAEFNESRRLHDTRAALRNAALCLRALGRYDEALAGYEEMGLRFPDESDGERVLRERGTAELRRLVATVVFHAGSSGASISVDGIDRGTLPAATRIRVAAGLHTIVIARDGYRPTRVERTFAGETETVLEAELAPLAESGRLLVAERDGAVVEVLVDGAPVGTTPWEGSLAPGEHTVSLRGAGHLGSQPVGAPVTIGKLARVTIPLEDVSAVLTLRATPESAVIVLDGVSVGRGSWRGNVRLGPHRVEAALEGYLPQEQPLEARADVNNELGITLERDRASPLWGARADRRFFVSVGVGPGFGPAPGGRAILSGCGEGCAAGFGAAAWTTAEFGYRLPSGLTLGVAAGYLFETELVRGRRETLLEVPDALRADAGIVDDTLRLHGFVVTAMLGAMTGERVVARAAVGAGATIGSVSDTRSGTFTPAGGASYTLPFHAETKGFQAFTVASQVGLSVHVTPALSLGGSVRGLLLVPVDPPSWTNTRDVSAPGFLGFYEEAPILGSATFVVSPTLDATLSF